MSRALKGALLERFEKYTYDREHGDLLKVETFDGNDVRLRTVSYEYDPLTGWLLGVNAPEGRIEYDRDARGRLVRVRTSTGIDTHYAYDDFGQMTAMADRALAGAADVEGTTRFEYDVLGRKESVSRPDGTTTSYEYEPRTGWTHRIAHAAANGVNILDLVYDRDRSGIIDSIAEWHGPARQAFAWNYGYDGLKRLTAAAQVDGAAATVRSYAYTYDRNGNRTSETINGAGKAATYNSLDQLLTAGDRGYTWDAVGRMTAESGGTDPARTYGWSVDDRLMSVAMPAGTITYSYDHLGTRTSRNAPGEPDPVERYLVDYENPTGYSQVLADVSSDATRAKRNYWYADGFGPMPRQRSTTPRRRTSRSSTCSATTSRPHER